MWRVCVCCEREAITERATLGKWGLGRRPCHTFGAGTCHHLKHLWSLSVREMGKHRKPGCLYSGGTWDSIASGPLGKQWLFGVREPAKEPRPCPVPDRCTILHLCCFIHFSKIFLHTFSFGSYTTTVRKIG